MIVGRAGRRLSVVNELEMEDYLRGVVPSEMPADFPDEALKAQAVAARTYARYRLSERGFAALHPTVSDQVYRGASAETDTSNRAVDATRGEVLALGSSVIPAYFHSTCGGMTERASNVWPPNPLAPRDTAWLEADSVVFGPRPDAACVASPHFIWTARVPLWQMAAVVRKMTGRAGLLDLRPLARDESWRVATFEADFRARGGQTISLPIDGPRLRMTLGPNRLKSLLCDVRLAGGAFLFTGNGWGHGVGLCQWGARGMAAVGATYREILARYYPGASLLAVVSEDTAAVDIGTAWPAENDTAP